MKEKNKYQKGFLQIPTIIWVIIIIVVIMYYVYFGLIKCLHNFWIDWIAGIIGISCYP